MSILGRKIDFVANCIAESSAYFFIFLPSLIFTTIIELKIRKNLIFPLKIFDSRWLISSFSHITDDSLDFNR